MSPADQSAADQTSTPEREDRAPIERVQPAQHPIFALTSEAVVTISRDFIIAEANPSFCTLMDWTPPAPAGRPCTEVLSCRDERRVALCDTPRCPVHEAFAAEGTPFARDLTWRSRSGKSCEVTASLSSQREGGETRAVIFARDVTLVNTANRMRANFISMVSHELRTPLHSINGFLDIVLDGQVGPLNARQEEFLNYARTSAHQLATLVEDILFISKADSGQFTLRLGPVTIPAVVEQAIHPLRAAAEKAEVRLTTDLAVDLPIILADELRLQQVLTNLLNNAIKFSGPDQRVLVSAMLNDSDIRFAVSDQGKGISAADQARIFERFYQAESSAGASLGGYGLGLSIAKLIVEQHNGHIWVESQIDEGSTFYFTLPIVPADSHSDVR